MKPFHLMYTLKNIHSYVSNIMNKMYDRELNFGNSITHNIELLDCKRVFTTHSVQGVQNLVYQLTWHHTKIGNYIPQVKVKVT